ncbi:MAG: YraN family protein [Bryobacterales bacterium]|nr:YraN family protein [Bryobacterales bacterium]
MSTHSHFSIAPLLDLMRHAGRQRHEAPHMVLARRGEDLAHRFVERELGWQVVARNYRHPMRKLEIDMVAVDGETLVIAEVKTRASDEVGSPLRAVDGQKAWHIGQGARAWIKRAETLEMAVRFDVLTVIVGETERVEYHKDVYSLAARPEI